MISNLYDKFINLDIKLQVIAISATTTISLAVIGYIYKFFFEKYSLKYRLNKEFIFDQKRKLKEEISKNKIPLVNIAEQLNRRLFNHNKNLKESWHKINKSEWEEGDKYYTASFVYRFLIFIYWLTKTENDTLSIDSTIANKSDINYLKFIKSFKDLFCDKDLIIKNSSVKNINQNHFFKNRLEEYTKHIFNQNGVKGYNDFRKDTRVNYSELQKVINYFSNIDNDKNEDPILNVLRSFHILLIVFLNNYGHSYQKVSTKKKWEIYWSYSYKSNIHMEFWVFLKRSKLFWPFIDYQIIRYLALIKKSFSRKKKTELPR